MRSTRIALLSVILLLTLCFALATNLDLWFQTWQGSTDQSSNVLATLLGDARRMFSNHFFVKADAYYHSGFYPTIFDNTKAFTTPHMAEDAGAQEGHNTGDELGFMGPPQDWIEAFGRHFIPNRHTHLDEGGPTGKPDDLGESSQVGEILPWLQLSATLDPQNIRTYTVAAYWLRERMNKVAEAEQFLREGLRANPGSYEILYELGRVYNENHHDPMRARSLWRAALKNWYQQEGGKADPDKFTFIQITSHLAKLEENQGDYPAALAYMKLWKSMTPNPQDVQKLIDEFLQAHPTATNAPSGVQFQEPGGGH